MKKKKAEHFFRFEEFTGMSAVQALLVAVPVLALLATALWLAVQFLDPLPPRRITLAAGPQGSALHALGLRYAEKLGAAGIKVDVRATRGAGENADLLSGHRVDAAFLFAGTAPPEQAARMINVSNLAYVPLWCFGRTSSADTTIAQMKGQRIAVGVQGSGLNAWLAPLLAVNGVTPEDTVLLHLTPEEAVISLSRGEVDVIFFADAVSGPSFQQVFGMPGVRLLSFPRAEAYARRFTHVVPLRLPPGTLDLARNIPENELLLIGTTMMIAARSDIHPTVVDFLVDASRQLHSAQGIFEKRGEFPNMSAVDDVPVSQQAVNYAREGPSLLNRYLPLWAADALQRLIILAVPLVAVAVPLVRFLPGLLQILSRYQLYRWYADLRRIERQLRTRRPGASVNDLLSELDRIEQSIAGVRESVLRAGELYTLRVHLRVVRDAVRAGPRAPEDAGGDAKTLPGNLTEPGEVPR